MEKEGVIKYSLAFKSKALSISKQTLNDINACRAAMKVCGLLGQDPLRYGGYGFGNISTRSATVSSNFIITGSQTSHHDLVTAANLAQITHINTEHNQLYAQGEVEPSSESMTHGVLYQSHEQIHAVVHVHSPEIWHCAEALKLAYTSPDIPYGTPEMANAVKLLTAELVQSESPLPLIFVMKGHEDGVVAAGSSLQQCTDLLLGTLKKSKAYAQSNVGPIK